MMYESLQVGEKEYKLRLRAKDIVALERKLGKSPLEEIMTLSENQVPKLETLLMFVHAAMQSYEHNIKIEKVYDIYDEYVEQGNTYMDLVKVTLNIFKVSGFFPEEALEDADTEAKTEKN